MAPEARSHHPSLPPELWDKTLDFIPEVEQDHAAILTSLLFCSLVCHEWAPRALMLLSSYKVSRDAVLKTAEDLSRLARILTRYPHLCSRVQRLTIVGSTTDQSWVSAVATRLAPRIRHIDEVTLRGVDLSNKHSDFYKPFALFTSLQRLILDGVRYTHFFQVSRLIFKTRVPNLLMTDTTLVSGLPRNSDDTNIRRVSATDARLLLSCSYHVKVVRVDLKWEELSWLCKHWRFAADDISMDTTWPSFLSQGFQKVHAEGLENAIKLFTHFVFVRPAGAVQPEMRIYIEELCRIILCRREERVGTLGYTLTKSVLKIEFDIDRIDDDRLDTLCQMLKSLSSPCFDVVQITLKPPGALEGPSIPDFMYWKPQGPSPVTAEVLRRWRRVDDTLCHTNFARTKLRLILRLPPDNIPHPYECSSDLFRHLLPKNGASKLDTSEPWTDYLDRTCPYQLLVEHNQWYVLNRWKAIGSYD